MLDSKFNHIKPRAIEEDINKRRNIFLDGETKHKDASFPSDIIDLLQLKLKSSKRNKSRKIKLALSDI